MKSKLENKFKCPICNADIDMHEHLITEKLSAIGYLHLDKWVKCPKCKYTPAFGKELSDPKPIYWRPAGLPLWFRRKVEEAFHKHTPPLNCPFCTSELELHKIWIHTWKRRQEELLTECVQSDADVDIREAFQFFVTGSKRKVGTYFIPAGIMSQYKCRNWRCKYVRYVTL